MRVPLPPEPAGAAARSPLLPVQVRTNQTNQSRRFLRAFHWNGTGLSMQKLDELRLWFEMQQMDIAVLTETRWTYTNEWSDHQWMYVHSGSPSQPGGGVLCMVSRRICQPSQLRWAEALAGRILHLQLRLPQRNFDLIGCYQFSQNSSSARKSERKQWWNCLDQYLGNLPKRNVVLLAGDFKCHLDAMPLQVGTDHFRWQNAWVRGASHEDTGIFQSIIRAHALNALNTWDSSLGPTYVHQAACSRIDYFLTRIPLAEGVSKSVKYAWDAPFVAHAQTGHVPMICQLRRFWIPPRADGRTAGLTAQQREAGRHAYAEQHSAWTSFMQTSGTLIQAHFARQSPEDSHFFPVLHQITSECFSQSFPALAVQAPEAPYERNRVGILNQWRHRANLLRSGLPTKSNLFSRWFHFARLCSLKRSQAKHARQVRRQRFDELLQQAQIHAQRHDSYQLFKLINRFAPKQPRKRMQLRNQQGCLATPVEEHAMLKQFVSELWKGREFLPCVASMLPGLPFDEQQLRAALRAIPCSKAVAKPFTPGLVWHALADLVAPLLYQTLEFLWDRPDPVIPTCWKDSWLILIPKPFKPPNKPESLRPLALQEPLGKCLIGLLSQIAQHTVLPYMIPCPIWAYLPTRTTQHALLRVAGHCRAGRQLVESQRATVFQRVHRTPTFIVCGAAQLFIDLTRAFDCIPRPELFGRLPEMQIDPRITHLLTKWHESTCYHVGVGEQTSPVRVGVGVRQGCKAAPLLFNTFLRTFLTDLSSHLSWEWIQNHMDLYADDIHADGVFHSECEMRQLFHHFGMILECLQDKGMVINAAKSAILLTMGGTSYRPVRARWVTKTKEGESLCIQGLHSTFWLPVVKQTKYLGVIVSYAGFESATVAHRLSLGKLAFRRLRSWLTARKGLTTSARFHLWQTCVFPVMTYGIFTMGLTLPCITLIHSTMTVMIRHLLRNHSFITGHSNLQVFQHHRAKHPLLLLWKAADCLLRSATQTQRKLDQSDLARTLDWNSIARCLDLIQHAIQVSCTMAASGLNAQDEAPAPCFLCPYCDFSASTLTVLRQHCTRFHRDQTVRAHVPDLSRYMLHGLPQCRFCHVAFTTWRQFAIHVQRGCQAMQLAQRQVRPIAPFADRPNSGGTSSLPGQLTAFSKSACDAVMSHEFGPRLVSLIQHRRWSQLISERAGCTYLARNCILCGQFVGRALAMHQHYRTTHQAPGNLVQTKAAQLTNLLCDESPCSACGLTFMRHHSCNVWFQVAMLLLHWPKQTQAPPETSAEALTCEICGVHCPTAAGLHTHLQQAHHLVSSVWAESRDSVDGTPQCRHCGSTFQSLSGLRSHINQGRCRSFNPDLPTEPRPVSPSWREACCFGRLEDVLMDSHNRLQLTLHCQCCTRRYQRAADLSAHLQQAHPALWMKAQEYVFQLMSRPSGLPGCICNPCCNVLRGSHICQPYWQLAMQFCRIPDAILMPQQMSTVELARTMPPHIPMDLRDILEQALRRYDVSLIWTDALMLNSLSDSCYFCGLDLQPAELCYHLHEAHAGQHDTVKSYISQLLPHALKHSDSDCVCFACGQVFNQPAQSPEEMNNLARQQLVRIHLRTQCPSVTQLALVLTHVHHGTPRFSDGARRRCSPAGGPGLPESGTFAGRGIEALPESGGAQAPAPKRTKRPQAEAAPEGVHTRLAPGHPLDGTPGHSDGSRHSAVAPGNHVPVLLQLQRAGGRLASPAEGDRSLAPTDENGIILLDEDASETTLVPDPPQRDNNQDTSVGRNPSGIQALPDSHHARHPPAGWHDPLQAVGRPESAVEDNQQDSDHIEENVSALFGTTGHVCERELGAEISRTSDSKSGGDTLEAPTVDTGRRSVFSAPSIGAFTGVDARCHEPKASQSAAEYTLHQLGDQSGTAEEQGEGQRARKVQDQCSGAHLQPGQDVKPTRAELVAIIIGMTLENPNNLCVCVWNI